MLRLCKQDNALTQKGLKYDYSYQKKGMTYMISLSR